MRSLRNRDSSLTDGPSESTGKEYVKSRETGKRFLTKEYVCSKEKKKISRGGGERREDFPAEKDKRNLKVIATLSLNLCE